MHTNATVVKIVKSNKVDNTKPQYKADNKKHVWKRQDEKRKLQ